MVLKKNHTIIYFRLKKRNSDKYVSHTPALNDDQSGDYLIEVRALGGDMAMAKRVGLIIK